MYKLLQAKRVEKFDFYFVCTDLVNRQISKKRKTESINTFNLLHHTYLYPNIVQGMLHFFFFKLGRA